MNLLTSGLSYVPLMHWQSLYTQLGDQGGRSSPDCDLTPPRQLLVVHLQRTWLHACSLITPFFDTSQLRLESKGCIYCLAWKIFLNEHPCIAGCVCRTRYHHLKDAQEESGINPRHDRGIILFPCCIFWIRYFLVEVEFSCSINVMPCQNS